MTSWKISPSLQSVATLPGLQWGHDDDVVEDKMDWAREVGHIWRLQWGHDDDVVEDMTFLSFVPGILPLQWGHDDDVVEDLRRGRGASLRRPRFNGATTMTSWKI